ncbi:UDP-glucose dehydrogenase family protein [Tianweitania sediminis]|uniref:UDP-glucose 6-dehydrogenase n=1 Tax=Tianweitania sediminis TaxID=1502156 RepID=A0A8J7ULE3_9HYPH|nr:UDP-glucose/GDP-mannose dehydrogenase family protein [Tianweitania sediminis]MBP0440850.1 UDP-glucose/GDP-mannose dehydrogenase family protein [Tianweitania sediminis]
MKIAILGAGYVGLTTGTCLAELGHDVTCVDLDEARIAKLNGGEVPIFEPGLEEMLRNHVGAAHLRFTTSIASGVDGADAVFIAVGTPSLPDGDIDLSFVEEAARSIARLVKPNCVIVVKSTVVVGTCKALREIIAEERGALDFSIASNPEFLREGSAVSDFLSPDRVVFGSDDPRARALLEKIYQPLADKGTPILCTTNANAELIKYSANAFLALKIGFINDVANLCEQVGGDVNAVAAGIGLDKRIGSSFLAAGPGYGGSCFPKDTRAFAAIGRKHGTPQSLIENLIASNDARPQALADRVLRELGGDPHAVTIAVLGLAFKANTDDVRESPSLAVINRLLKAGCTVRAHDPKAMQAAAPHISGAELCDDAFAAVAGADAVIVLTEWDEYRQMNVADVVRAMRGRLLVDYRNLWNVANIADLDVHYVSIGRAPAPRSKASGKVAKANPRGDRSAVAVSPAG